MPFSNRSFTLPIKSILMVCRGNICRSPMAEGYFSYQLNNNNSSVTVSSAGISAMVNHSADNTALDVMHTNGIDINSHRARQLSDEIIRKSDLILVMTNAQLQELVTTFLPARGKTFLLGCWQRFEIADPYQKDVSAFHKVFHQIELAWQDWKTRI